MAGFLFQKKMEKAHKSLLLVCEMLSTILFFGALISFLLGKFEIGWLMLYIGSSAHITKKGLLGVMPMQRSVIDIIALTFIFAGIWWFFG